MKIPAEVKHKNIIMQILAIGVSVVSVFVGISSLDKSGVSFIICGVLIFLLTFYKTVKVVDEDGFDDIMTVFKLQRHHRWAWKDIDFIYADFRKASPYVVTYFRSGKSDKQALFQSKYMKKIFQYAIAGNPDIKISENSDRNYNIDEKNRFSKSESKGTPAQDMDAPRNFHELAVEAKKIKRQMELEKPDPRTLTVKRPPKNLKRLKRKVMG